MLALQSEAQRNQPLRTSQRRGVQWKTGEGAGHTGRNADEREQGNALEMFQNQILNIRTPP